MREVNICLTNKQHICSTLMNIKSIWLLIIFMGLFFVVGISSYEAKSTEMNVLANVSDIAITGVEVSEVKGDAILYSVDSDSTSISSSVSLPNINSSITYKISVTNFGSVDMGIKSLNISSDDFLTPLLKREFKDYTLEEKICDENGKCNSGITKVFYLTLKPDVSQGCGSGTIMINFEFAQVYSIKYGYGIQVTNMPTSVLKGQNLTYILSNTIKPENFNIKMNLAPLKKSLTLEDGAYKVSGSNTKRLYLRNVNGNIEINRVCVPVTGKTITRRSDGTPVGQVPKGEYLPGDEYVCNFDGTNEYHFYILNTNGDNVNLILDRNVGSSKWNTTGNISDGPVEANNFLKTQTSSWTSIFESQISLPTASQLGGINEVGYYPEKAWLYDYLLDSPIHSRSGYTGYWTSTTGKATDIVSVIYYLGAVSTYSYRGFDITYHGNPRSENGVRPVVTLKKGDLTVLETYGDLNADGLINTKDSELLEKYISEGTYVASADVFFDGVLDEKDITVMKQAILDSTMELPLYKFPYIEVPTSSTKTVAGKIPQGNFEAGDEYIINVDGTNKYHFYVISTEGNIVNLIMNGNICSDGSLATSTNACNVFWASRDDYGSTAQNDKGPITALNALYEATKNWSNIENISVNYDDEGDKYKKFVTYGSTAKITNKSGTTTSSYTNLKARLPKKSELENLGCTTGTAGSCPAYLVNRLQVFNKYSDTIKENISNIKGYWTLSSTTSANDTASSILYTGRLINNLVTQSVTGIRPVISIPKSEF